MSSNNQIYLSGLPNLGATCYMNSALQIIAQLFSDYVISGNFKRELSLNDEKVKNFMNDFSNLIILMRQNNFNELRNCLIKIMNYLSTLDNFKEYGRNQADSSGFLINLIDLLSEYTKHSYTINIKLNCLEKDLTLYDKKKIEFANYLKDKKEKKISFIDNKLTGYYKYSSQCSHEDCGYISEKMEPFTFLLLDIEPNDSTLENSIQKYIKPEKLNKDNQITCEKCKRKSQSTRKISFWKFSDYILIGLKRFNQTYIPNKGIAISKNNSKVKFPVDNFNVSSFVEDKESNMVYDLCAAVIHVGNCNNGHYVSVRRIFNQWYLLDDSKVVHLTKGFDISGAYYLLYKKKET